MVALVNISEDEEEKMDKACIFKFNIDNKLSGIEIWRQGFLLSVEDHGVYYHMKESEDILVLNDLDILEKEIRGLLNFFYREIH